MKAGSLSSKGKYFLVIVVASMFVSSLTVSTERSGQPGGLSYGISIDSLEALDRFLSIRGADGELRSRFVLREEDLQDVADSIAILLSKYTGSPAERLAFTFRESRFTGYVFGGDSMYTAENIMARLDGNGEVDGVFLVTAHYDAISHWSSEDWRHNWDTWPAPGADDNGSGVSTVLELARVLDEGSLPFDVVFILFSGEELGMLGSKDFMSNYDSYLGDRILGVLNIDMIGYNSGGSKGMTIYSNFESGWLAEVVKRFAENSGFLKGFQLRILKPSPANSDHAPFWDAGYPAVTFVEPVGENGESFYPYYHTMGDTLGWVDFEQVKTIGDIIHGFLLSFSDDSIPDYTVLDSDVILERFGFPTSRTVFKEGDTLVVRIRVRNISAAGGGGEPLALKVRLSNNLGEWELLNTDVPPPAPLESFEMTVPLVLDETHSGENVVEASIQVTGMEDDESNNKGTIHFAVSSDLEPVVISHSVQPNPITGPVRNAAFCINLADERNLYVEIFNMEGESICSTFLGDNWGINLDAGMNCVRFGDLFDNLPELSSGIYIYRLVVYNGNSVEDAANGKFAVVR